MAKRKNNAIMAGQNDKSAYEIINKYKMLHHYYAFRRNLLNNFKSFSKSFSKDGNISISGLIFSGFIL